MQIFVKMGPRKIIKVKHHRVLENSCYHSLIISDRIQLSILYI